MKRTLLALILSAGLPLGAEAHDMASGPNGGPIVEAAGHHVEFTAKGDEVTFYLSDEGAKPIASAGASGTAIVQQAGKTGTVPLTAAAPNKLGGHFSQALEKGAHVVISAKLADGHAIQARFVKE